MAIAALSAMAVARGYSNADRARQAEASALALRGSVLRVDAAVERALIDPRPAVAARARSILAADLGASVRRAGLPRGLRGRTTGFASASSAALDDAPAGSAGARADAAALSTGADGLSRALADRAQAEADRSHAAAHTAGASALYVFLAAALVIGLLFARLQASRREAEVETARARAMRDSEEWFRGLVQHASDTVFVVDPDSTIRYVTPSVERLLGREPGDLPGRRLADLAHGDDRASILRACSPDGESNGRTEDWRLFRADGTTVVVEAVGSPLDDDAESARTAITLRDVGDRRALEEQLRHRVFHDELTGLANRPLFEDRTTHALARARRSGERVAVLFLDLDDFKTVNDALGHDAGDELLREAAQRLCGVLRTSDTAARLGGDEFAVLLDTVRDEAEAREAGERALVALRPAFRLAEREVFVRASLGLAVDEAGQRTSAELLRDADAAMYEAKRLGKGQIAVFEPRMRESVVERLQLRAELERAIERGELELHYQPIVELATGEITQVEALVRWRHPERGLIPPGAFIPVAEESGLVLPLGRYVLREACRQAKEWADDPQFRTVDIAVNVSPRQLEDPGFVDEVSDELESAGLPAERLVLEITEHALMRDVERVAPQLAALRDLGVSIALDDFGTGYSSLAYLREFALDSIKIDRAFINELGAEDDALVRSITGLAERLSLQVVAEGIEEPHQLEALRQLRCHFGQGFLLARPLPVDQVTPLLRPGAIAGAGEGTEPAGPAPGGDQLAA